MVTIDKKVVLVTGGGRGIGRAIALAFAAQGNPVAVTGRTQSSLDQVADEIRRLGADAVAFACDVTRRQEVEALKAEIEGALGTAQILVNSAGMAPAAAFLDMEDQLWEEVFKVNLTGTYYGCKVFLPGMIACGWGRIINIASTVAKVAYSHITAYAASKHAVLGLTRALAIEMARKRVTVNAICPGYVDTEMTRSNAKAMAEKTGKSVDQILDIFKKTSPQGRLIDPKEVGDLALMLASNAAGGITGQAINVDGGAVMV
ncbi:MAG: SDR family oxidoreductase [Deltaproteobacteria bacterium]|nr:SDR family oxidoreductase [Deltaproteobacteria bacterium]